MNGVLLAGRTACLALLGRQRRGKDIAVIQNSVNIGWRSVAACALLIVLLSSSPSHSQLALGKSKFLGNAITFGNRIPTNYLNYWNQATPGNDGKWGSAESTQGVYTWSWLDNIYNFALSNGILFKDHNLVWGQQQPSWITLLDSAAQRAAVMAWIDSVGRRYPKMDFIDVVNEPFNAPPPYKNALGGDGQTGWDWVITAFTWARQYCSPGVKLIMNEYNILQDNSVTSRYIALIDTLKTRGLIDGIGIQGHYFEFKSTAGLTPVYSYPVSTLKYNLQRLGSATGLPIYISEFDINEANDSTQLANYKIYFPLFWESPYVKGITLWGYNYGDTWKPNAYLVRMDGTERPALQWLRTYLAHYLLQPVILSPIGTTGGPRNPLMTWHPSVAASSYQLQVATDDIFANIVSDTTAADTVLRLSPLSANMKYYWHVRAFNASDTGDYSAPVIITTGDTVLGTRNSARVPNKFNLSQNYPNPFNPTTVISYQLPVNSDVTLKVYDALGREVGSLVEERQLAGEHRVAFSGARLPSGVYFCKMSAGEFSAVRKLVLVR